MVKYDMDDDRGIFQGNRFKDNRPISGGIQNMVENDGEPFNMERTAASTIQDFTNFNPADPQSVRELQAKLNQLGVSNEPLALDGVYGPKTEEAINAVQSMSRYNPGQRFGFKSLPQEPSQLSSPELKDSDMMAGERSMGIASNLGLNNNNENMEY